jgi:hypothetical protein
MVPGGIIKKSFFSILYPFFLAYFSFVNSSAVVATESGLWDDRAVGRLKPLISLALIKLNYENLA